MGINLNYRKIHLNVLTVKVVKHWKWLSGRVWSLHSLKNGSDLTGHRLASAGVCATEFQGCLPVSVALWGPVAARNCWGEQRLASPGYRISLKRCSAIFVQVSSRCFPSAFFFPPFFFCSVILSEFRPCQLKLITYVDVMCVLFPWVVER